MVKAHLVRSMERGSASTAPSSLYNFLQFSVTDVPALTMPCGPTYKYAAVGMSSFFCQRFATVYRLLTFAVTLWALLEALRQSQRWMLSPGPPLADHSSNASTTSTCSRRSRFRNSAGILFAGLANACTRASAARPYNSSMFTDPPAGITAACV